MHEPSMNDWVVKEIKREWKKNCFTQWTWRIDCWCVCACYENVCRCGLMNNLYAMGNCISGPIFRSHKKFDSNLQVFDESECDESTKCQQKWRRKLKNSNKMLNLITSSIYKSVHKDRKRDKIKEECGAMMKKREKRK